MHPNDPFNYNPARTPLERPPTNGLGIAGFVVSLLGLGCGCLSIVGVILSAIAMGRRPRGFAIAGLIIGLVGMLLTILVVVLLVAFGFFAIIPVTMDGYQVNEAIKTYQTSHNGALPQNWSEVPGLANGMDDPWGHPYVYVVHPDGKGVELLSRGMDGIAGNDDDLTVEIRNDLVDARMGPTPPTNRP